MDAPGWNGPPGSRWSDDENVPRAKALGECRRCDRPYFAWENTISRLCDPCLERDHDIAEEQRRRREARAQGDGDSRDLNEVA